MKRLLTILFLLPVSTLFATDWSTDGTEANVQNLINNNVASGDRIIWPIGTNHWTWVLTNNSASVKHIQMVGVGADLNVNPGTGIPATNTYTVGGQTTCIIFDVATGGFTLNTISNDFNVMRITGFTFMRGTNTPTDRTRPCLISIHGTGKTTRIDHNHFWLVNQCDMYWNDWSLGCADHNVFWDDQNCLTMQVDAGTWLNQSNGNGSWADTNSLGSTNAVYVEWNIATNIYSTSGILDGDQGGRAVVRYNTTSNLPPVTTHGTDTGHEHRSFRQLEYYGNWSSWDTNEAGGFGGSKFAWSRYLYSRGGTVICFSNSSLGFQRLATLSSYRAFMGGWSPWFGASGTNVWDTNSPTIYYTGTHNGANSTVLSDSTANFNVSQVVTGYAVLNLTRGSYGVISSATATTLSSSFASGSQQGVGGGWGETNILWVSGDQYQVYYIDQALDDAGQGNGDLITGGATPVNSAHGNVPQWTHPFIEKCYEWNNTMGYYAQQQSWLGQAVAPSFGVQMPYIRTNAHYIDGVMVGYTQLGVNPLDVISDPAIVSSPQNVTVTAPSTATFSVSATGTAPLTYQWTKNGSNLAGATQATLVYGPTSYPSDNGVTFACVVSGPGANSPQTSGSATLTVNPTPQTASGTLNSNILNIGNLKSGY